MLLRLGGITQPYPWGSRTLIPEFFRTTQTGEPIAEIWFGTHPMGDSTTALGSLSAAISKRLGYLVKFLSAETPLSLQVHPDPNQAKEGFARENAMGLALTDPKRKYKDESDKPEILIALTEFRALCGFRPLGESAAVIAELASMIPGFEPHNLAIRSGAPLEMIFELLQADKSLAANFPKELVLSELSDGVRESALLVRELLDLYPGDTGALISILMNHVVLNPFEAIFLPAGNLHAYLGGLGVEVMKASDNVIRGGLTKKHIDTADLRKILVFQELSDPVVRPKKIAEGLVEYETDANAFRIYRAEVSGSNLFADLELPDSAIVVCTSGEVALGTSAEEREVLRPSEAAFISRARSFSLTGSGCVFVVLGH